MSAATVAVADSVADLLPLRLDRAAIEQLLPHRGQMLFVHEVQVLDGGLFAGSACWAADLPAIQGHFPGQPIVPAVYLVEAAAQIAGAGLRASRQQIHGSRRLGVLAMIQRCKFLCPVLPGQALRFTLRVDHSTDDFAAISGCALVDMMRVAELSFVLGLVPATSAGAP